MTQYLIAVAVGPVQEFIASARKLRDLWYGSYLLSERSKAVARSLAESDCELIFPAVVDQNQLQADSTMNVTNKLLALSPAEARPEILIKKARQAFTEHWRKICEKALQQARRHTGINEDLFNKQIDDFGEFFAVWYPYDPENYVTCRQQLEARLNGCKNFRFFHAPNWDGAGKPKSSLDGIRESVIKNVSAKKSFMLKEGEHLDALGIVKRFGPWEIKDRPQFDNLAQVAIQPFLCGLRQAAIENRKIADIITSLPTGSHLYPDYSDLPGINLDTWADWPQDLPPELLHPAVFEDEKKAVDNPKKRDRDQLDTWNDLGKKLSKLWQMTTAPQPYAALLLGDGDRMGEALNQIKKLVNHQQFSRELDIFSQEVHKTVARYEGKVIYSGGDDVMAYVPLHKVLDCAEAVNQLFAESMAKACRNTEVENLPTFSVGLALIHQRSPLHEALNQARKAEHYAKQSGERNALAIVQDKRSGAELVIYGKWNKEEKLKGLVERLQFFIGAYGGSQKAQLSSRLGYQLRELEKEYGPTSQDDNQEKDERGKLEFKNGLPDNVLAAETLRFIEHKKSLSPLELIGGQTNLRALSDELVISRQLFQAVELSQNSGKGEDN